LIGRFDASSSGTVVDSEVYQFTIASVCYSSCTNPSSWIGWPSPNYLYRHIASLSMTLTLGRTSCAHLVELFPIASSEQPSDSE